jgi:NADH-quinone oxidoreductase subunit G
MELDTIDEVRRACLAGKELRTLLSSQIGGSTGATSGRAAPRGGIERIADVPMYFADPLARRSPPLQRTKEAQPPRAWMNSRMLARLGVAAGQPVSVKQGSGEARLMAALDDKLPEECVRVSAAHPTTAMLGPMFGTLTVEKAAVREAA